MNYLQDMFAQAQQGQAIDNLARTYGISSAQAKAAVDAMLPAFEVGIERTAQSQQAMIGLFGTMARNPYAQAFENPTFPMGAQVRDQGNDALAAMFGSPDVSRAVAVQAAATTGLSAALLKQMLPAIAAMVLGGLMKGGAGGTSGGGFGDLLGGMLGGGAQGQGRPTSSGNPLQDILGGMLGGGVVTGGQSGGSGNTLQDILGGMFGGGAGGASSSTQRGGTAGRNPLEDLLGGMFGGGQPGAAPQAPQRGGYDPEPEPEAPAPRQTSGGNPLEDLLNGMFGGGAGRAPEPDDAPPSREQAQGRSQDPALQPFKDIFDQFFDPKRGR